ncbi:TonB-dependent receptor [Bordetella genomosp. 9]|uniref:TonB-dependent siderophore receptor n=1 Tax=Bordetella genomosp. 9 TaxID=1416803 RepID=A0A1W6YVP9_9BORD|nr:TonB-dependent receptor [Bordetella genomosp. 9]ARP85167.1 TonB-dependent siderophore receptor [Bordetella genomosp. 9]
MNHVFAPARHPRALFRRTASAWVAGRICLGALAVPVGAALAPAAHAQGAATRHYDIPPGTLEDALNRFGRESGIMLSFRPEIAQGRQSAGLQGGFTVQGGLDALLAGTGIQAIEQSNGGYVLNAPADAGAAAAASAVQLPTVTVSAAADPALPAPYAGGQVATGGGLGLLGTSDAMDVPFSTTNYTEQALEDIQARTLADVVVNESSVRTLTSSGGFGEDFQIRGFTVSSSDIGLNGLYGLTSSSRMPAAIMERVEVLKGPGTLMYGIPPNGSIGGGINIVTKRAGDDPLTRLTTTYESKGRLGGQFDVGRRFGEDNAWGIRVNGVYRDGATAIDKGNNQQTVGAVGLDYRGKALRWSLDAYDTREDIDNFRPQIGFQPGIGSLPSAPSGHRNFFPGTKLKLQDSAAMTRLEYDVNEHITVYGAAGYRYGSADQTFPWASADERGNFDVLNAYYDSYSKTSTGEIGARARFDTFGVGHTVSLAANRLHQEQGNAYITSDTTVPSNIYHPSPLPPVTAERISPSKASETTLSSIALADTLSFANDRLLITGGLRHQRVELDNYDTLTGARTSSYDEDAVSPLAGIVFKPWSNVSLYGNFTSGLTRGDVAPIGTANAGQAFAPYKSKQYEAGVKVDWGSVVTTASVFQIKKPNSQTDPVTNVFSYGGEQRNRGLELSAYGEVVRGLRVMASTTFFDAKLTHTAGGMNDGNDANGVPDNTWNLGVDWDTPWVDGLSLNARVIHTSSTYYDAANTVKVPSWTRYDVGARYMTEVMGKSVILRANIENLFGKDYWLVSGSYVTPAAPRTVLLSAQIDF